MIGDASIEEGVSVSPFFQRMRHASLRRSNQQVERHLDLARQLAVHYSRRTGYDQDDLRQVGLIGLIKASRSSQMNTESSTPTSCAHDVGDDLRSPQLRRSTSRIRFRSYHSQTHVPVAGLTAVAEEARRSKWCQWSSRSKASGNQAAAVHTVRLPTRTPTHSC